MNALLYYLLNTINSDSKNIVEIKRIKREKKIYKDPGKSKF